MSPQIFEALMLICFGAAWPISIYKILKSKNTQGKSITFLFVILAGYVFGIMFNLTGTPDKVLYLYFLNAAMVLIDMGLSIKYRQSLRF